MSTALPILEIQEPGADLAGNGLHQASPGLAEEQSQGEFIPGLKWTPTRNSSGWRNFGRVIAGCLR